MAFLFGESQIQEELGDLDGDLTHLFERAAEVEERDAVNSKTDLASALKKIGIEFLDLEEDPSGTSARFEDRAQYSKARNLVAEPDNLHALAILGWVALPVGDVAMSNEDAEYRMRFLEIATASGSDSEAEVDAKAIVKDAREFATTEVDRDSDTNPVEVDDKTGEPKFGKAKDGADPEGKPKGSTKATSESLVDSILEGGHKSGCACGFCKNKGKGFGKKSKDEAPKDENDEDGDSDDKKDEKPADNGIGEIGEARRVVTGLIEDDFVTCGGCSTRFDYDAQPGYDSGKVKCPECKHTVDEAGRVINLEALETKHRGYAIRPVEHQGTTNYVVPSLGSDQATSLATAKRWIDQAIASKELKNVGESQQVCPGCTKPFNAASNPGLEEGKSKCPNCGTTVKLGEMMTTAGAIPALEMGAKGDGLETKGRGGPRGRKFKMPGQWKQNPAITKKTNEGLKPKKKKA